MKSNRLYFSRALDARIFLVVALLFLTGLARGELVQIPKRNPHASGPQAADAPLPSELKKPAEDYETFEVMEVSGDELDALKSARPDVTILPSNAKINLANRAIDTSLPEISAHSRSENPGPVLKLIQFKGPVKKSWTDSLEQAGATILHSVPHYAFLLSLPSEDMIDLSSLPGVRWVGEYRTEDKIQFRLSRALGSASSAQAGMQSNNQQSADPLLNVTVQIAQTEASAADKFLSGAVAVGAKLISKDGIPGFDHLKIETPASTVRTLAGLPNVTWIELSPAYKKTDERADQIVAGAFSYGPPLPTCTTPGYDSFLSSKGVDGTGLVVQVMDGGLDKGIATNANGTAHADLLGRIAGIQNVTADVLGSDPDGHGTINAGIIMGNAALGVRDASGFLLGKGVAPKARVFATKVFRANNGPFDIGGNTFADLTKTANQNGATVSSNSWGSDDGGTYSTDSQTFDSLARDANKSATGNQGMLFVFAAGNAGPANATIDDPGTGKNVIAVGASENCDAGGVDGCGVLPAASNNMYDLVSFSGRGPVQDGRLGVTLIAPGTHIQGPAPTVSGYTGVGVCDQYWPTNQTNYARSSGTSHATPIISGAALLFSQFFKNARGILPSAALIKAALICGADDMFGGSDGNGGTLSHRPNPQQGWGRINLKNTLATLTTIYAHDQNDSPIFLNSGEQQDVAIQADDPSQPLRIVLAWTDAPGAPTTGGALVNDLDLIVEKAGAIYRGNNFSNGFSISGGTADSINNVEAVFLENPGGSYLVSVRASTLVGDGIPGNGISVDQDYALYVLNGTNQTSIGTVSFNSHSYNCAATVQIQVSDSDLRGAGTQGVTILTQNGDSEVVTLTESIPGTGIFNGEINTVPSTSSAPTPADGTLQVVNGEVIRVSYDDAHPGDAVPAAALDYAQIDCVGPVISNVLVNGAGFDRFNISWLTDVPSNSAVYVGVNCGDILFRQDSPALTTIHQLTVGGLDSCTKYKVLVSSTDVSGNTSIDEGPGQSCYPVRTLQAVAAYDHLDPSPISGWVHAAITGVDDWRIVATGLASSQPNAWFSADVASIKDAYLITPPVTFSYDSVLSFNHTYALETGYDGAIIEVSTDGGGNWTDLGPYISQGGYNVQISDLYSSPIAGRRAWSGGNLGAMTQVKVDMGAFVGTGRLVRFRIGCDKSVASSGWYIDDLGVTTGLACPNRVEDADWVLYQ